MFKKCLKLKRCPNFGILRQRQIAKQKMLHHCRKQRQQSENYSRHCALETFRTFSQNKHDGQETFRRFDRSKVLQSQVNKRRNRQKEAAQDFYRIVRTCVVRFSFSALLLWLLTFKAMESTSTLVNGEQAVQRGRLKMIYII